MILINTRVQSHIFVCDNYCKIERFIVKIENFKKFYANVKSAQKKVRCAAYMMCKIKKTEFFEHLDQNLLILKKFHKVSDDNIKVSYHISQFI